MAIYTLVYPVTSPFTVRVTVVMYIVLLIAGAGAILWTILEQGIIYSKTSNNYSNECQPFQILSHTILYSSILNPLRSGSSNSLSPCFITDVDNGVLAYKDDFFNCTIDTQITSVQYTLLDTISTALYYNCTTFSGQAFRMFIGFKGDSVIDNLDLSSCVNISYVEFNSDSLNSTANGITYILYYCEGINGENCSSYNNCFVLPCIGNGAGNVGSCTGPFIDLADAALLISDNFDSTILVLILKSYYE